jgi:ketosteroid isomerase-like protein
MPPQNRFANPLRLASVAAILLALGACSRGPGGDDAAETNRLLQTDREFARASVDYGMAEAFRAYLHEDAIIFRRGAQPIRGRDAIYDDLASSGGDFVLEWDPQEGKASRLGDLGWTWGVYTVSSTDSLGIPQVSYGRYVNVWKKDRAGEWKVLIDIGNPSPPPDAPRTTE